MIAYFNEHASESQSVDTQNQASAPWIALWSVDTVGSTKGLLKDFEKRAAWDAKDAFKYVSESWITESWACLWYVVP